MYTLRKFSPMDLTLSEFEMKLRKGLEKFDFFNEIECKIEDSLPWLNLQANRVIKPEEVILITEALEKVVPDEILTNSLSKNRLRFVFNARFHLAHLNVDFEDENDYSEEYAHDFGETKANFKTAYGLF